jgi:uracil-DNA glycosylase
MNPKDIIHPSWMPVTSLLNQQPLLQLSEEILPNCKFYPEKENIFRALSMPLNKVKVVILGQDPYFSPKFANGLAFAVNHDIPIPPSLEVIRQELIKESLTVSHYTSFNWRTLEHWQDQGVLLLNTALTVEAGKAGSHLDYWDNFTRQVVHYISSNQPCIWLLWGKKAQYFTNYIVIKDRRMVRGYNRDTIEGIPVSPYSNYVLTAAHPAAEAYSSSGNSGFYGCDHFYFANKILSLKGEKTINW